MHIPKRSFHCFSVICAGLALLLCSGCMTESSGEYRESYKKVMSYQPTQSPTQINASATVETNATGSPEFFMQSDRQWQEMYLKVVAEILEEDMVGSGLFARIQPVGETKPDYIIKIRSEESRPSDFRLRVTLQAFDAATQQEVSAHTMEKSTGTSVWTYTVEDTSAAIQQIMPRLKADLATDLIADMQAKARRQQERAARAEAEFFTKASLFDLLARSDKSVFLARERNLAIVAAKNQQLPAMLRDRKTDELSALVVKIEQTILDLNHECERAKDRAQQATATNGDPQQIDKLLGLAISYRERIELLKPILTALKEEIANRNR